MTDQQHPDADKHLGLAGNMARAFIHSPLSPLLLVACLAIGVLGLIMTPRQEDPQISVPMVDIFVQYPGASSQQVATLVADPLERLMSEISGVKHVYSVSQRESAMVTVQFKVGEEMENSLVKLYDKLASNTDRIPPGVSQPLVKPKGVDDTPVVTLTLWSSELDDAAIRLLSLDLVQRLKEVKDTSQSFIVGGRSEQLRVEALPERMAGFGISLDQLANTIRTANSKRGVGSVEAWDKSFRVYTGSFLRNARDVERLVVAIREGAPVYVRDVAKVIHGPEETNQLVNYYSGAAYSDANPVANGAPAVTLAIAKKKGSNGVSVANDILAKVEALKGRLIPDNVHVSVTRNYGESANQKVNELIFKLFIATGIVTLLVWWFLGSRASFVVTLVIPVVILVTVFFAWILEFTIDRVSLFALIFSIGILVDDAIVVVENIYRRWLIKGEMDTETSVDAVREVGNPTILATFTVIAALLPMGFVSGMMGPYMMPIPALGSVAMIFSLFAAFIFTPWLVMRTKPSMQALRKAEESEHKLSERLDGLYRGLILPLATDRKKGFLFLFGIVALFFLSCVFFYTHGVVAKMLPLDNKPEFNVTVNFPEGTALPVTANLVTQLAEKLRKIEEVTAVQTYVGTASPFNFNGLVRHYYLRQDSWQADIQVQLLDKGDRDKTSHEIALLARELVTPLAKASGAKVAVVEMPPGPPVLQSVVAEVYGPSAEIRRKVAEDLTQLFEQSSVITDVDNLMQAPYEIWHFDVNTEKAVRQGITVNDINRNLEMAMGGYRLGDIKQGNVMEPTRIVLQVPLANRSEFSRLGNLLIANAQGETVPLSALGRFKREMQDPLIFHKDLRDVEFVTGDVTTRLAAPIYGMFEVDELLKGYLAPDGVPLEGYYFGPPKDGDHSSFEWTGEWTVTYETFRDMGIAFGVAILLIYMLVVWEFGNFTLPAIVISPIPLTLIGIIPGHWLFDAEFTATSMIGFIALAGIIVRNSILLVDFTREQVREGIEVTEAIINSCKARTRPIVITAAALMGGSVVILSDPIFQGMAISLFFGILVATLLTLVVIPLGCMSASRSFGGHCPSHDPYSDVVEEEHVVVVSEKTPLLLSLWSGLISAVMFLVTVITSDLSFDFNVAAESFACGAGG
ncbi:MAG: efflux RND transporter permease subunit [Gammaproteobacteria bacterium]|nr:efflux RND transporter permease subunit [Gammaproteobacteria bacterium]